MRPSFANPRARSMASKCALLATFGVAAFATPSFAGSNVVCDNGLRCVMAPCPSTNAYDVKTKKYRKVIWVDIEGMSAGDRKQIELSDALYRGTLVISGRFKRRTVKTPTGRQPAFYFFGESIVRESTRREQRLCMG